MDWGLLTGIIIAAIIVAVLLGLPIAVCLGLVSVIFMWRIIGFTGALSTVATEFTSFWSSYTMLALPLFILMGEFLFAGGVVSGMFDFASKWLQRVPGGLSMVSIGAGALFGTISGSSLAGVATIGVLSGPEMLKRGYSKRLTAGSICAAGGLAHLIPPSIMAVLYAGMVEVSVGKQLMAGLMPGIVLAALYAIVIIIWVRLKPDAAPIEPSVSWGERFAALRKLVLPFIVVVLVLGSIYTGVTTVTEAAGVGTVIGIIIAIAYRRLHPKTILEIGMASMQTTCFIMLIAVGGKLLSWTLTYYLIPQNLINAIVSLPLDRIVIMVLLQIMLIILGMFIDPVSIIVITTPILIPVLTALKFDLIWYGAILLVNLETALITPPVGFSLYIVRGIMAKELALGEVIRGALVFGSAQIALIALLIAFPIIALWVPSLM